MAEGQEEEVREIEIMSRLEKVRGPMISMATGATLIIIAMTLEPLEAIGALVIVILLLLAAMAILEKVT